MASRSSASGLGARVRSSGEGASRCVRCIWPRPGRTGARRRSASASSTGSSDAACRPAFLKPVGQRTIIEDGVPADEDAVLMKQVFGLPEPLRQMSPVHIPRGFTQAYIEGEVVEDLPARIRAAHAAFADRDILLIEGTGHAGVGAVIGLSNAVVAATARGTGGDRLRGRRRAPDRRDRAQRVAVRALRRHRRGRDRQQGRPRRQARARSDARARASPVTASRCSASCRTARSSRTRPWRWSWRASTARRSTPAPTSTR